MKKIYTLKIRHAEHYFVLLVSLGWIIHWAPDIFYIVCNRTFDLFEWVFFATFLIGAPAFIIGLEWLLFGKELLYATIDENGYQSYLFRKKYCYVDKGKDIYYALYYFQEYRMDFIVFSNEPFKLFEEIFISKKIFALKYMNTHDCRKVILLPYNEKTRMEFDIENWKKAEYIKYGQYNWKTKTVEVRKEEEDC